MSKNPALCFEAGVYAFQPRNEFAYSVSHGGLVRRTCCNTLRRWHIPVPTCVIKLPSTPSALWARVRLSLCRSLLVNQAAVPLLAEDGVCACRQASNQWPDVTSQSRQCVHPQGMGRRRGFHSHAAACAAALALMPLAKWRGQLLPTCAATLAMLTPYAASSRFRFPTLGRWKVDWLLSWMPAGPASCNQRCCARLTHLPCTAGQAGAHCAAQPRLQSRALRHQMPPTGVARVMLRAEGQGSTDASQPAARQHLCPQTASASASS